MNEAQAIDRKEKIEWKSAARTLLLPRPSIATEGAFGGYLEGLGLDAIQRQRGRLGELGYREALAGWTRDCATGVYAWGSLTVDAALNSSARMPECVWLTLTQVPEQENLAREQVVQLCREQWADVIGAFNAVQSPTPTTPPG